jgi:hypothetical protein
MENLQLAFSFSAGEFLDEELELIEEKFGKIDFITKGKCIKLERTIENPHNYQWWTTQEAIDKLNKLYYKDDIEIRIILKSQKELNLLKEIFNHTTPNEFHKLLINRENYSKNINTILIGDLSHNIMNSLK